MIDGTPCSYDQPGNLCVQGQCVQVGCDRILDSPLVEDQCGICAGDGSKCSVQARNVRRVAASNFTKVAVLPRGARHIQIEKKHQSQTKVSLVLRERKTGLELLDSGLVRGSHWSTVSEGTKFQYQESQTAELVTGRGPLLAPVLVGVRAAASQEAEVRVKFITENLEDTHSKRHRYEWVIKGWSRCSKDCGGGVQRLVIRCFDSLTGQRIKRRLCGPKKNRPRTEKRSCNTFRYSRC